MRSWMVLLVLAVSWRSVLNAQRATVEDLRRVLAAESDAREKDAAIAHRLSTVELTEQLTEPSLKKITADFMPGPKTALALEMLADVSSFLAPPASEFPVKNPPDKASQLSMIAGAADFVKNTLPRLPDFLATRETRSFDDSAPRMPNGGSSFEMQSSLHLVNSYSDRITYRNGQEVLIAENGKTRPEEAPPGFSSSGEFGPTLVTILTDSAQGRIVWSHWEQMPEGLAGVFSYQVPAEFSHYQVDFCCTDGGPDQKDGSNSYHGTPAYHGFLYIDPATGAVLRYTVESELRPSDPIMRSAESVQYGRVSIGANQYLCPVLSEAIMQCRHFLRAASTNISVLSVNEVHFTGYRRFGSTSRILPAAPPQ